MLYCSVNIKQQKLGSQRFISQLILIFLCRRYPLRHHRHGPPHLRDLLSVRGCLLHAVRRALLRGLHGCHPALLHLHRPVDVHPLRLGQRARQVARLHGCGLDRVRQSGRTLVLFRLRLAADLRWHPLAGKTPINTYTFS